MKYVRDTLYRDCRRLRQLETVYKDQKSKTKASTLVLHLIKEEQ